MIGSGWKRVTANPVYLDALIALLLSPMTLLATVSIADDAGGPGAWMGFLLGLGFTVPLIWRRRHAERAGLVVVMTHLVQLVMFSTMLPANVTAPLVLYAVVVHGEPRRARWWLAISLVGALAGGMRWGWPDVVIPSANALQVKLLRSFGWFVSNALVMLVAWFSALWVRQRRVTLSSLRERAAALEGERDTARALAIEEERSRIAREMHDIVAHSLSVIVVQADGAAYLARHGHEDPLQQLITVGKAVETIGATARAALAETRQLVGVLRHTELEFTPAPGLAQITELVAAVRIAGREVMLTETGEPTALPAGAQTAAYRVVQEALSNALKHAGSQAQISVHLHHDTWGLGVRIIDDGAGAHPETAAGGAGHGLIGMRERVAAWGGDLTTRTIAGGGFEVRAHLPTTPGMDTTI